VPKYHWLLPLPLLHAWLLGLPACSSAAVVRALTPAHTYVLGTM